MSSNFISFRKDLIYVKYGVTKKYAVQGGDPLPLRERDYMRV